MNKSDLLRFCLIIALCALLFVTGLYLLDRMSVKENPILGNTFYIIVGNLLMAGSLVGAGLSARNFYRLSKNRKNKRGGSKVVFLEDEMKRRKSS